MVICSVNSFLFRHAIVQASTTATSACIFCSQLLRKCRLLYIDASLFALSLNHWTEWALWPSLPRLVSSLSFQFQLSICLFQRLPSLVLFLSQSNFQGFLHLYAIFAHSSASMFMDFPDPTFAFSGSSVSISATILSFSLIWSRSKSAVA